MIGVFIALMATHLAVQLRAEEVNWEETDGFVNTCVHSRARTTHVTSHCGRRVGLQIRTSGLGAR